MITFFVIAVLVIALVVIAVIYSINRENNISKNGIKTDGVVLRNEVINRTGEIPTHKIIVRYRSSDGLEHDGVLNVNANMPVGRKLKINYIDGKFEEVVFVSQDI